MRRWLSGAGLAGLAIVLLMASSSTWPKHPLALPRGCRDRSCVRGRTLAAASPNLTCGTIGGPGPCDAGFTGFDGFALGTFGWGSECSGAVPLPGSGIELPRYTHTGNVGFTCYDGGTCMYLDKSATCCMSTGDCVEMWGDEVVTGGNYAEVPVSQQWARSDAYGVTVSYATKQWLGSTRDLSLSPWTTSGTGSVSANAYRGPFGNFLSGPIGNAMARLHDTSAGDSFTVSQVVPTTTAGRYAFSCWIRGDTATSARMSMTGAGNSTGDRTCTKTSLDTSAQGQRYGCVGTASYTGSVTSITVGVAVGSASGDTGDIGVSDCQLERDFNGVGIVSMYVPNLVQDGGTFTRGSSGFVVVRPDAGNVSEGRGCLAAGVSRRRYDAESWFSVIASPASGAHMLQAGSPDDFTVQDTAAHTADQSFHIYDSGFAYIISSWDGGSGKLWASWDGGTTQGTFSGTVWSNTSDLFIGTTGGGAANASEVQVGPIIWAPTEHGCDSPPTYNSVAHKVYAIGDGWSGGGAGDGTFSYPSWVTTAEGVVAFERRGVNTLNRVYEDGTVTQSMPARFAKFGYGIQDSIAVWVGYNDIAAGVSGAQLFSNTKYYVTRKARMNTKMYWFPLAPSNGVSTAQTSAYYGNWLAYCLDGGYPGYSSAMQPEPNVKCIDAHAVLAPDGGDYIISPYDAGSYLSPEGAQAVGNLFLQNWP